MTEGVFNEDDRELAELLVAHTQAALDALTRMETLTDGLLSLARDGEDIGALAGLSASVFVRAGQIRGRAGPYPDRV